MLDVPTLLGAQDDAESSDNSNAVCGCAATSGEVVQNRPSGSADAMRDHLRFTRAEVPMLDSRNQWDIRYAVRLRPCQRAARSRVLVLSSPDLTDHRVRNGDARGEAFNQV